MKITHADLDALNRRFEGSPPRAILRFVHEVFGERAAILSSMQRAGTALCHLADRAGLDLDVLFVDTGVLHAETLATRDTLAATHPHLRVHTLQPEHGFLEQTRREGLLYITKEGQERCCELRKSAPLLAARGKYDVLIGALRRDEGGARAGVKPFALDVEMNALRAHPFASFTREELDAYITEHPDVVVNPLHLMGFPTIGCFPCTTPVLPDEPERAGRWRHLASVAYCGINPTDRGAPGEEVVLDDRYAAALLG
ncbi:phosphoadenylyl-sulfate reductase [Chondromyces apiculatus]|uniref:Phosphoadenylyl-sulfate reductase n=1 Tax=Chondromyces apiculatus DSM 436 TaxID=1192034 RepID=A0A017T309_9BACT|nr:phosphoadenylyl-sulfate reductase [Chondromyces apiculatus]EYF03619.1 Phosphoadenylyl-sulfate reductase [Chondromyces apiculatus DSM 436]